MICARDPRLISGSICFQSQEKSTVSPPKSLLLLLASCKLWSRHSNMYLCPMVTLSITKSCVCGIRRPAAQRLMNPQVELS